MRSLGVEEEFLLLSRQAPELAAAGEEVTRAASCEHPDDQFEHELTAEQAEIGSRPLTDLAELDADLRRLRTRLAAVAGRHDCRLLATGTSPVAGRHHTTAEPRYRRMLQRFGPVGQDALTCGMHVHVGVDSAAEGVGALDRIRPWLAVLTALSANSPLVGGADTGYAAYRPVVWGRWPTAGPTEPFGDVATYRRVTAALVAGGAALDDAMLYFDARLSDSYPTLEIRVADVCARPADAVTVAALGRGLVETAAREHRDGSAVPPARTEILRAAAWRASRDGTDDRLIDVGGVLGAPGEAVPAWELVGALVDRVGDALGPDRPVVEAGLDTIRADGSGARLQRQAFAAGGADAAVEAVIAVMGTGGTGGPR